ncbi:DUF6193 family natural product biosynthesis protein [Streptomyces sp. NPDC059637]|uniref:DUF6193 family natural product biosynthesis protein n=1 Tax=Streptomyces sp. NPDC059637 TaxID=3347752 RepID=UPI0036B05249
MDESLYPDIIRRGGLAAAMDSTAQENGIPLGPVRPCSDFGDARYTTAKMNSERGPVTVFLGLKKRLFVITLEGNVRPWSSGSTEDLVAAVKAMSEWRRGVTLEELNNLFPFMSYDNFSRALERGDPVERRWEEILDNEEFVSSWPLLRRVREDNFLCTLFPFISHGVLHLSTDYSSRTADQVWIAPVGTGGYRVGATFASGEEKTSETIERAMGDAVSLLRERRW